MSTMRVSPLVGVVFTRIFLDEHTAGPAMKDLLNAILVYVGEETVDEIISMRSEYPIMRETANSKYGRHDVRVRTSSRCIFDIEVQTTRDFMNERCFYYASRIVSDEFESVTQYDQLPEIRVITIDDFYVREGSKEIVEPVSLIYEKNTTVRAREQFRIYHIQLPEFRKKHKTLESVKGDRFLEWMYLLDRGYEDEKEMEVLAGMSEGMLNFAAQYNIAINDPKLKWRYRLEQDGLREKETAISVATKETTTEVGKKMKAKGFSVADIAEITGLTAAEVEKL